MGEVLSTVWDGLQNAFLMAYEVWWALVLGFAISAIVQAWVPRERVERALAGTGVARGRQGDGARRRVLVVLLRGDRDRPLAVRQGRVRRHRALVPVRVHEPGLGAGIGPLGPDRVAVRSPSSSADSS